MRRQWLTILFFIFNLNVVLGQETFIKKIYFDDEETKLREIITLNKADSTLHGLYQSMYENGSLSIKGYYKNDRSDSTWIYYFENGKEKAKGNFSNGKQNGLWKYYFENGKLKHEGDFLNDAKHGHWTYYYENGSEKSSGIYSHDEKEGIWNYFYEDGTLKAQAAYQDGNGMYKGFYPSGKIRTEGKNVNEKSEGIWTYYYETGETEATGNFTNGLRNGFWQYFHKNGEVAAEGHFVFGEKSGLWKYYFPDGSINSEGNMVEDQKDGYWKLYYIGGEIRGEGRYDMGNGDYVEYYPSGKQKASGKIKDGKKNGKWVYYNEEGVEDGVAHYQDGIGTYKGYYPDGTLKMKGRVEDGKRTGTWTLYNADGTVAGTYTPVYEEEKPIFRTSEALTDRSEKKPTDKPEYHYKNKKSRYFNPVINEYTAYILSTNPLWTIVGQLPVSVEYYLQERLGHEVQITFHNKPFFREHATMKPNRIYRLGAELTLRQKFYHTDSELGMFYFGHQLSGGYLQHSVNYLDSTFQTISPISKVRSSRETRYSYGVFIGNRWSRRANDSGVTIDLNLGFGLGKRHFNLEATENPQSDYLFSELNRDKFYLPVIVTLNIGFAGPKRRSTSF